VKLFRPPAPSSAQLFRSLAPPSTRDSKPGSELLTARPVPAASTTSLSRGDNNSQTTAPGVCQSRSARWTRADVVHRALGVQNGGRREIGWSRIARSDTLERSRETSCRVCSDFGQYSPPACRDYRSRSLGRRRHGFASRARQDGRALTLCIERLECRTGAEETTSLSRGDNNSQTTAPGATMPGALVLVRQACHQYGTAAGTGRAVRSSDPGFESRVEVSPLRAREVADLRKRNSGHGPQEERASGRVGPNSVLEGGRASQSGSPPRREVPFGRLCCSAHFARPS
jgi:hypothetical protein